MSNPVWDARLPGHLGLGQKPWTKGPGAFWLPIPEQALYRTEAHHLSVRQVRGVLGAENINLPAGTVKVGKKELQIRVAGRFKNLDEIANTVIGQKGDALVRIRDVADVSDAFEEPQEWAWSGGLPAIAVIIQKQSGANTVNVINDIKERLKMLKHQLPSDIELHIIQDNS